MEELACLLQWRSRFVFRHGDTLAGGGKLRSLTGFACVEDNLTLPPMFGIDRVKKGHDILDDLFVVEDGLLHPEHLLQDHLLVGSHFGVPLGELLKLLGLGHQLLVHQVDLLNWDVAFVQGRSFPRSRGLSPNVVQRVFVVGFELGVLEFPCLMRSAAIRD